MKKVEINPVGKVFLAIILCLFMAEALSRILLTEESSSVIQVGWQDNFVQDNFVKGRPVRNEGGTILYHEPFSTRFNTTKPIGTFRIIFLGGSMTIGTVGGEIAETDVFTRILEAFLRYLVASNQLPEGHDPLVREYEILNFGVQGYALVQIEQVFSDALAFEPDLLIYNYDYTDDFNTTISLVSGSQAAMFEKNGQYGFVSDSNVSNFKHWILSYRQSVPYLLRFPGNGKLLLHSWEYRFLNKKLSAAIQKLDPEFTPLSFNIVGERAKQSLDRMIAAARRERVPFVIMLSPSFEYPEITGAGEPGNPLVDNCHSGQYIWDVPQKLASSYSSEELKISGDNYDPNRLGQAVIAEALQPYFERYVLNQSALQRLIPSEDEEVPCVIV